jgi:hypothetical protein
MENLDSGKMKRGTFDVLNVWYGNKWYNRSYGEGGLLCYAMNGGMDNIMEV